VWLPVNRTVRKVLFAKVACSMSPTQAPMTVLDSIASSGATTSAFLGL
jgi:hypothetical protein